MGETAELIAAAAAQARPLDWITSTLLIVSYPAEVVVATAKMATTTSAG